MSDEQFDRYIIQGKSGGLRQQESLIVAARLETLFAQRDPGDDVVSAGQVCPDTIREQSPETVSIADGVLESEALDGAAHVAFEAERGVAYFKVFAPGLGIVSFKNGQRAAAGGTNIRFAGSYGSPAEYAPRRKQDVHYGSDKSHVIYPPITRVCVYLSAFKRPGLLPVR
jgi:hypothetical protein